MVSTEQEVAPRPTKPQIFASPQKQQLVACLLLLLATLALYNPVTRAPFLNYDDQVYVTDNLHVRAGLTWKTVVWAFRSTEATNWHPVTWLSHALDCQTFGLAPAGPHIVNVLLHAANAILLFLILRKATGAVGRSLAVAALFALHPINVESVAWISERKNVLSMFFFLIALSAYGWYVRRPATGRYLAVTAAYALGLMTKPQVITFPFALLLLDYWPLRRLSPVIERGPDAPANGPTFWNLVLEKTPWFALSAASAIITMKAQTEALHHRLSAWIHLGNAAIAYVEYIGKAFWPVNLAVMYPHPEKSLNALSAVLAACTIAAVSILAVIFRERRPFFVGWFWFLGITVPMAGLVQTGFQSMADRYAYIPLLGIFVMVCWGAVETFEFLRIPNRALAVCAAVILLALGLALHRQVGYWQDNLTLWNHTLEVTGPNFIAEDNVATALIERGRQEEALPHMQRAHLLRPDDPLAILNLATYDRLHGHYQDALDGYAKLLHTSITTNSSFVTGAYLNSGYAHYDLRQWELARQDFETVVEREPENAAAYRALGLLAQRAGHLPKAVEDYQRSVGIEPTALGYLLLAQALERCGQKAASRAAQFEAAQSSQNLARDAEIVSQLLTY